MSSEPEKSNQFPQLPQRYEAIESSNLHSSYLNDPDRPFNVYMSAATAGKPRLSLAEAKTKDEAESIKAYNKVGRGVLVGNRFSLAGNMSTVNNLGPIDISPEERAAEAEQNMVRYISSLGINPGDVRVLSPDRSYDTPMQVVNIDDEAANPEAAVPTILGKRGDFIYTYNPDVVLGVRPADCPLVIASAETPKGRIYMMVHFAWRGAASPGNGVADMAREFSELGVDFSTLDIYVTPGGHAETFTFKDYSDDPREQYPGTDGLFEDVEKGENGYSFGVDTPFFVYQNLLDLGITPEQIYLDTSDTSSLESGYASHTRSFNLEEDNNRDMVIVELNRNKNRP